MKTGAFVLLSFLLIAALPINSHAGQSFLGRQLVLQSLAGLQKNTAATDDGTGLATATARFLSELRASGLKQDSSGMELAVQRYASELESARAAELNPACSIQLIYNLSANGWWMLQEVISGDTPVCLMANLASQAAAISSAQIDYDICVIDQEPSPDAAQRSELVSRQRTLGFYGFAADAAVLFLCTESPTPMDYYYLLMDFIGLW